MEGTDKHASDRQKRIGFAVAEVKVYFCGVHPLLLSTVELGNFSLMK